jgi:DNA modification methylase
MRQLSNTQVLEKEQDVRLFNILRSPKKNGSATIDSVKYLKELGISIEENRQTIQFSPNHNERIHGWAPYVQGFSASFVQSIIDRYVEEYSDPFIMDPFSGCGTVLVQAKLNGIKSFGVELNPLLQFVADTKVNSWDISPEEIITVYKSLRYNKSGNSPSFLKSHLHFRNGVLDNLLKIKQAINSFIPKGNEQEKIKNILRLAFSAILIDSSNLKRSPCLGYDKTKDVRDDAPMVLFDKKVHQISDDIRLLQRDMAKYLKTRCHIELGNSATFEFSDKYDLVITSPPYMNGMDYVINYKIEMAWLDFVENSSEAKKIKDEMVVCDNVSKGLIRRFSEKNGRYTNEWIENIKHDITKGIRIRGNYRRKDMPEIVHKYFDDMYHIMKNVARAINKKGRFILVIGDSLIADVYVPTDLIIAKIGNDLGLEVESIELARNRRSGQVRSYKLRETVLTLKKR